MANEQNSNTGTGRAAGLGLIAGVLGIIALLAAAGLTIVYTGVLNVAATEEHASFTRWALDTTFHNSVERHARSVAAPERITAEMAAAGAAPYKAMCQHCHGGPGAERASWANGMRPRPPHLTEDAPGWKPEEVFWIVKNGVRMTGMPAFGPSHDDQTLWSIAAFVKELPAMSPERYSELGVNAPTGSDTPTGSTR